MLIERLLPAARERLAVIGDHVASSRSASNAIVAFGAASIFGLVLCVVFRFIRRGETARSAIS